MLIRRLHAFKHVLIFGIDVQELFPLRVHVRASDDRAFLRDDQGRLLFFPAHLQYAGLHLGKREVQRRHNVPVREKVRQRKAKVSRRRIHVRLRNVDRSGIFLCAQIPYALHGMIMLRHVKIRNDRPLRRRGVYVITVTARQVIVIGLLLADVCLDLLHARRVIDQLLHAHGEAKKISLCVGDGLLQASFDIIELDRTDLSSLIRARLIDQVNVREDHRHEDQGNDHDEITADPLGLTRPAVFRTVLEKQHESEKSDGFKEQLHRDRPDALDADSKHRNGDQDHRGTAVHPGKPVLIHDKEGDAKKNIEGADRIQHPDLITAVIPDVLVNVEDHLRKRI